MPTRMILLLLRCLQLNWQSQRNEGDGVRRACLWACLACKLQQQSTCCSISAVVIRRALQSIALYYWYFIYFISIQCALFSPISCALSASSCSVELHSVHIQIGQTSYRIFGQVGCTVHGQHCTIAMGRNAYSGVAVQYSATGRIHIFENCGLTNRRQCASERGPLT